MKTVLHFSLGPVQGFIAVARRTRDLWAGSFLLSWLAGQGMAAIHRKGGRIEFPEVAGDELFEAIMGVGSTKKGRTLAPYIGSLPNRFKADIQAVEGDPGKLCAEAVNAAWMRLCDAVWTQFIAPVASKGRSTKGIWDREVGSFWQMSWVIGQEPEDGSDAFWLDLRKNWRDDIRSFASSAVSEPGDLCTLMGHYQEISGFSRIKVEDSEAQREFYDTLRSQTYIHAGTKGNRSVGELNIGLSERLCAIALVKRLFPLLDEVHEVIGWRPGAGIINVVNWPSVSYVAAVPWLERAAAPPLASDRLAFSELAQASLVSSYRGETETRLFNLPREAFFELDGHLFHEDGLRAWPTKGIESGQAEKLVHGYQAFCKRFEGEHPKAARSAPSEFYAILLMDGDRIGELVSQHPDIVKEGLGRFTQEVQAYFAPSGQHGNPANGVLIYAGGDDVLALVPLDSAVSAACFIRKAYREAFEATIGEGTKAIAPHSFTLSGALILAQYKIPFRAVLEQAHHYLDDVAKDKNGRDSLAIAVLKPGGVAYDWVTCWEGDHIGLLEQIARDRRNYSTSYLYNVRERYTPLLALEGTFETTEGGLASIDEHLLGALLAAEYVKQPENSHLHRDDVRRIVAPLLRIGKPLKRVGSTMEPIAGYAFDSALLARFLSQQGLFVQSNRRETEDAAE